MGGLTSEQENTGPRLDWGAVLGGGMPLGKDALTREGAAGAPRTRFLPSPAGRGSCGGNGPVPTAHHLSASA